LFHDCNDAVQEWAVTTVRPFVPLHVYDEILTADGRASMVIVPRNDRTLRPERMAVAARTRLGLEPILIDGGHCPHVARPTVLADLISKFHIE
jgi:hypothetical protein